MRKMGIAVAAAIVGLAIIPAHAATETVMAAATTYAPAVVVAHSGDTIAFSNTDVVPHTLTTTDAICKDATSHAVACNTNSVQPGGSKSFVVYGSGQHTFHCNIHGWMMGIIVLQ